MKMKKYIIIYLVLCLAIFLTSKAEIIKMNDENFQTEIYKLDIALVIFHAPWCGQCRKLMMKLPEIDLKMEEFPQHVPIITVNCETEGKSTCDRYQIEGFPILKSFLKGVEYGKFEGSRDVHEIVEFMRIESSPVARKLSDFRNLEEVLRSENRVCVVANLKDGSKLEGIFFDLAERMRRKISFLYCQTVDGYTWIKVYRHFNLWNKFEEHFVEYNGDETASAVKKFILNNYHGLAGIRTFSNRNEFSFPLVTVYYDIDYEKNLKLTNYWRNRVLKVATKYKDKFSFAISSKKEFQNDLSDMGVENLLGENPIVVVVMESNEKYILSENFSVDTFDVFLRNIQHKSLNPHLKSQHPTEKNDSLIIVAVGSNFYDIVIKSEKDIMVKIFADWCGHCKKLQPTYKKLAQLMRNENVTFVEIDGTENDLPTAYTPTGYPTIYWSSKEYRMNPILYKGDRTIDDFIKFIAKHASAELKNYGRDGNLKRARTEL